jgi:hypothetical protein
MRTRKKGRGTAKNGLLGRYIAATVVLLLIMHLIVVYATVYMPGSSLASIASKFDLDNQYNVPTFINSLFFIIGVYYCIHLARRAKWAEHRWGWTAVALLLVYLALDEALTIHERMGEALRKLWHIQAGSPLAHAWIIPAVGALLIVALALVLVKDTYKRFGTFAGILLHIMLLIGGVILLDVLGSYAYDRPVMYRMVMVPLEEIFELGMTAILWLKLRQRLFAK